MRTKIQKQADKLIMKLEDQIWEVVREEVFEQFGETNNEYMKECVKQHQAMKTYVAQLILMQDQR